MTSLEPDTGPLAWRIAAPVFLFVLVVAVFWPTLDNGFINYDDHHYFIENPGIRGLDLEHLRWMFTTRYQGHFQPLNWLSYAIDFRIAGSDPRQYHRTQVLLHGLTVFLVYGLTRRILRVVRPHLADRTAIGAASATALLYGLHPLRVESVAWASARSDVLATIFYLGAVLCYLRAVRDRQDAPGRLIPMLAAWSLFLFALLSKEMAVTLPIVLILLDFYPLRRGACRSESWKSAASRRIWAEKVPFLLLAIAAAIWAFPAAGESITSLERHPISNRIAQVPVVLAFFVFKTLWPSGLHALVEFPVGFGFSHRQVVTSIVAVAVGVFVAVAFRRRCPVVTTCLLAYVCLLLPVSGIAQRGPQMVADRYGYLACLPLMMLIAGLVSTMLERARWPTIAACGGLALALTVATRRQIPVWHDAVRVWEHTVAIDPSNAAGHAFLGQAYQAEKRYEEALRAYQQAYAICDTLPRIHRSLASVLATLKRYQEAIEHYVADGKEDPTRPSTFYYMGVAYERAGDAAHAREAYRKAIALDPAYVDAHMALAELSAWNGVRDWAERHFLAVLALEPERVDALAGLADNYYLWGRPTEALQIIDRLLGVLREKGDTAGEAEVLEMQAEYLQGARPGRGPTTQPQ